MSDNLSPARTVRTSYLVIGLIFCGIAGLWVLRATEVIKIQEFTWFGPAILIGAGVIALAASLLSVRRPKSPQSAQPNNLTEEHDHE